MSVTVNRQIWCLWEPEGTLPPYLQLCLRTIERNAGVPVTLLTSTDVEDLAPALDPELAARVSRPGQRSDYYRSHLLAAQGGMWLDVDTVALRDVNWAFAGAAETGLGVRRNEIGISTTPLIARAGSPVMLRWISLQEEILRTLQPGDELKPWTALGATTLTVAVGADPFFELPRARVAPLPWTRADDYLSRFTSPRTFMHQEVSLVNMYNERFPRWLKVAETPELLSSSIMLARLIRVALGVSSLGDEERKWDRLGASLERAVAGGRRGWRGLERRARDVLRRFSSE